jgi:hypothetical protein
LKRILFLVIGTLLVLGLVLPGCTGGGPTPTAGPVTYNFTSDKVNIAIVGPMTYLQGRDMWAGAQMAQTEIASFTLAGHSISLQLQQIDAKEISQPYPGYAGQQVDNAIANGANFIMGGFRTEATADEVEAAVLAKKMFFICGAATDDLVKNVYTNYNKYKYLFRAQPLGSTFLFLDTICQMAEAGHAVKAALNTTNSSAVKVAFLAEALDWTVTPRGIVQTYIGALGYTYLGTVTCTDTATDLSTQMSTIKGWGANIIFTFLSGPVGITYGQAQGDAAQFVGALTVGINVEAQSPFYWTTLGTGTSGHNGAEGQIGLMTWCPGINITNKTGAFLANWAATYGANPNIGPVPIYTASTYDVIHGLVTALQSLDAANKTYVNGAGDVYVKADDLIAWYENPANMQTTTSGKAGFYPNSALYRAYVAAGLPSYPHDLMFGPQQLATGLGCEWVNATGTGTLIGVWPTTSFLLDYAAQSLLATINTPLGLNWVGYMPTGIQNITIPCWILTAWNVTCPP